MGIKHWRVFPPAPRSLEKLLETALLFSAIRTRTMQRAVLLSACTDSSSIKCYCNKKTEILTFWGTNLKWAMCTKGTNQKNILPVMLFSSLQLKGRNVCKPSVIALCLNSTFSLRLQSLGQKSAKIVSFWLYMWNTKCRDEGEKSSKDKTNNENKR